MLIKLFTFKFKMLFHSLTQIKSFPLQISFLFFIFHFNFISTSFLKAETISSASIYTPKHPTIQTHTSDTQTEFHIIVPKNKKYKIRISPNSNSATNNKSDTDTLEGASLVVSANDTIIKPAIEVSPPNLELLEKLLIFYVDGLSNQIEYKLELIEDSSQPLLADQRVFKTLNTKNPNTRFMTCSCLSDEVKYNSIKFPIWEKIIKEQPDFIAFTGDLTYVDAFDYLPRGEVTENKLWTRYFQSLSRNPLAHSYTLIPSISTWDDHDLINGFNKYHPLLPQALNLFNLMFGGRTLPGVIENGANGTHKWFKMGGINYVFFDGRTFRENFDTSEKQSRFGQFGFEQEKWFFDMAFKSTGPMVLIKGDMWGSPLITSTLPNGSTKRIIEGFFADFPTNFLEFMKQLQSLGKTFAFISGDIHRAQIVQHGPQQSISRKNPFPTVEVVSSPLYSYIYRSSNPETVRSWNDPDVIQSYVEYNYGFISATTANNTLMLKTEIRGIDPTPYLTHEIKINPESKTPDNQITPVTREHKSKLNLCLAHY